MSIKLKNIILLLPFIMVYIIPAFGILLPGNRYLFLIIFLVPIILLYIMVVNYKTTLENIFLIYRQTPFRYFLYMYLWFIVTGVYAVFKEYYSLSFFLFAVILGFFFRGFLLYLYPMLVFPKYITIKNLTKLLIGSIYFVMLVGIIEFIAAILSFQPVLNFIHSFAANSSISNYILVEAHSSIPRIRAFTLEPSSLSGLITAFLPFIYNFAGCKYKIFKNKYINKIVKMTIIPLAFLCLILTQSPIGLIFAICVTVYVHYDKIVIQIKKHFFFLIILILLLVAYFIINSFSTLDVSNSYLIRIDNVVVSLMHGDFKEFIDLEPSLANRVLSWIHQFQIFVNHPVIGIGFLNRGWILIKQIQTSSLPITVEMLENFKQATTQISVNMTTSSQLLYQTGIIGWLLYVVFMIKSLKCINKSIQYFTQLEKVFLISFKQYFVFVFVNSLIYGAGLMVSSTFFAMGIANALVIQALIYSKQCKVYKVQSCNGER